MKPHRRQRLVVILFLLITVGSGVTFMLVALNENINLFYSTEQILSGAAPKNKPIKAGGMVLEGSVERSPQNLEVRFLISDMQGHSVPIVYTGILPDLFREGQGVVTEGMLEESGNFRASRVLAKHDENYMPPELADMLKEKHVQNKSWSNTP